MKKNLRKNKKGFTLVEIIVVLLIIGILLAITIPSVMGYINKANEAKYIAEARTGFLAAQTINVDNQSDADESNDKEINAENVAIEINDTATPRTITAIKCTLSGKNIDTCNVAVNGLSGKYVHFDANNKAEIRVGTVTEE